MCSLLSRLLIYCSSIYRVVYKCCRVVNSPPGSQSRTPCFTSEPSPLNLVAHVNNNSCLFFLLAYFVAAAAVFPISSVLFSTEAYRTTVRFMCSALCPNGTGCTNPASACPLSLLSPSRNPFFNVILDGQNNHSRNYRIHNSLLLCVFGVQYYCYTRWKSCRMSHHYYVQYQYFLMKKHSETFFCTTGLNSL